MPKRRGAAGFSRSLLRRFSLLAPAWALPLPLVSCVVYVAAFRLMHLFLMSTLTFNQHAEQWLRPAAWGMSLYALAKLTNLLAIVYLVVSLASFAIGPSRFKRAHIAGYVAGLIVLVALQSAIGRTGNLAYHTYHLRHGTHAATPPLERVEHLSKAIGLFPRVALSRRAYLERAHAYRIAGRNERAVECYAEYIDLAKKDAFNTSSTSEAHAGMSLALWALGDLSGAEAELFAATGHGFLPASYRNRHRHQSNRVVAALLANPVSGVGLLGRARATEAVPGIIDLLEAGENTRRAIKALGNIGDRRAVPAIMRAVAHYESPHSSLFVEAAEALGEIGDSSSVPCLLHVIEHRRRGSRCADAAYGSLHQLLERDPLMPPPSRRTGFLWSGRYYPDASQMQRLRQLGKRHSREHPADAAAWGEILKAACSRDGGS